MRGAAPLTMMDFGTYRAHLGFMAIDLCLVVSSQPLQLFIKDVDTGDYGYSALVWHERLLYPDQNAAKAREAAKSKGGISGRLRSLGLWS
ncbi:hypothetical protein MNEG_14917 [Monoraphidium neglectum]|uniref:Uncharacterized protein n=1 Tax=Monoraphidium neglectum TaxID=145388 RepID=A0A0D2IYT4_9CHLO|nr:hypothetical protein MNEG_14917 [Monoraphidium neglectum]KIY93047.1 hypothetical protein MNEG_14917 [Monoraphidium neglectum]|eukprot:XP_013892067.1 hypothetical protein MNEG_14917 [Monoraphidium neglectum]